MRLATTDTWLISYGLTRFKITKALRETDVLAVDGILNESTDVVIQTD